MKSKLAMLTIAALIAAPALAGAVSKGTEKSAPRPARHGAARHSQSPTVPRIGGGDEE